MIYLSVTFQSFVNCKMVFVFLFLCSEYDTFEMQVWCFLCVCVSGRSFRKSVCMLSITQRQRLSDNSAFCLGELCGEDMRHFSHVSLYFAVGREFCWAMVFLFGGRVDNIVSFVVCSRVSMKLKSYFRLTYTNIHIHIKCPIYNIHSGVQYTYSRYRHIQY